MKARPRDLGDVLVDVGEWATTVGVILVVVFVIGSLVEGLVSLVL
ncbi:hypothetical protein QRX50_31455 [Amycolatopsis carbonis]|uniref:Uncharacterized protein n=1 Tax=Amycolatopsis carbonis TaxID=715471 RepID=A0A9Y2IA84_9PSEU|nr:hypothetical protein [Amycolatopsis sp. 2-15]WIX75977.1 hypothetical protein QRX50_31455 [Amycolatopsis sp. 2-15]